MNLSSTAFGFIIIYILFGLLKFNDYRDIWSEYDQYTKRAEIEFAETLYDKYLSDFEDDMEASFKDAFEEMGLDEDSIKDALEKGTSYDEDTPNPISASRDPKLYSETMEVLEEELPDPEEVEETMENVVRDMLGLEEDTDTYEALEANSLFVTYLVRNDTIDPASAYQDAKSFYREHQWTGRILTISRYTILAGSLSMIIPLSLSFFDHAWTEESLLIPVSLAVAWIGMEYWLWRKIRSRVVMEHATYAARFLDPVGENLFDRFA